MEFRFFTGRIDPKRKLPEGEGSGLKYQNVNKDLVELTKTELVDLTLYYKAYILRRLWQRERASSHYRWVAEPALKVTSLRKMVNGYRDEARKHAADEAYKMLMKEQMIQEFKVENPQLPGPDPVRVIVTARGSAWLLAYDRWFLNEKGERYLREPQWRDQVDEDGNDKHESTKTYKVKALKKISYV